MICEWKSTCLKGRHDEQTTDLGFGGTRGRNLVLRTTPKALAGFGEPRSGSTGERNCPVQTSAAGAPHRCRAAQRRQASTNTECGEGSRLLDRGQRTRRPGERSGRRVHLAGPPDKGFVDQLAEYVDQFV